MEAGTPGRAVTRAALAGQRARRLRALLPGRLRQWLKRRLARWLDGSTGSGPLDDWGTPLVAGARVTLPPAPPASAPRREARAVEAPKVAGDAPRCLLATSALDAGGMDEMVAFLARRLRRCGLHTAVLHTLPAEAPDRRGRVADLLVAAGVEVVALTEGPGRRWLRDWGADVISAHGALPWVLDEAQGIPVPYVDVLHGMHSLFNIDWAVERRRSRDLTAIVAVSEHVRRQYLQGVPSFPAERIVTIPNGVDLDRRATVDRQAARAALGLGDEFLFVSLARHCLQKNTYGLVSAFGELAARHPDAHLLVAGRADDPVYCAQVRSLRDSLPAGPRHIHLRDHASDPGLILSAADGFVLDSFFEGWALASMEALHAGVPVVASDVGGAWEQIGDSGDRGYVVPNPLGDPLDVDWERMGRASYARQVNRAELITAMDRLVRDRAHWAGARDQLAAESARRFHPDACAERHAALLRSLGQRSPLNARAA